MKKKRTLLILSAIVIILLVIFAIFLRNSSATKTSSDPNAVLPPNEGLPVIRPNETKISIGAGYVAIVKENGELWVWGIEPDSPVNVDNSQVIQSTWKIAENVVSIASVGSTTDTQRRGFYLSILYEDASLWAWDISITKDNHGEIHLSFIEAQKKIMEGVSSILADEDSILALKTNGSLWSIRKKAANDNPSPNKNGFTFGKPTENVHAFWVNPLVNSLQTYVLRENGELFGYGENARGQLGVGFNTGNTKRANQKLTKVSDSVISVITQSGWSDIWIHTMAIKDDHSLWLWGQDIWFDSTTATNRDAGEGSFYSNIPVRIMENVAAGAMSVNHSLVIKQDGSLWVWGYNYSGQLGTGNYDNVQEPINIMNNAISVSAEAGTSFAIQTDGSLLAWGGNRFGQLGTGDMKNRIEPAKIMENVASITTSATCSVAVKKDGSVWIWGKILYPAVWVVEGNLMRTPVDILSHEDEYILEPICIMSGEQK